MPDLDTLYSYTAPQPFVEVYARFLGRGPQLVTVIICILGLIVSSFHDNLFAKDES